MAAQIAWDGGARPLSVGTLRGAEMSLGVTECVRINHAASPEPEYFAILGITLNWRVPFGALLSPDLRMKPRTWCALTTLVWRYYRSRGLVPIAEGGGGDYICLDFRGFANSPTVVYYLVEVAGEDAGIPVAEGITALLAVLGPDRPDLFGWTGRDP